MVKVDKDKLAYLMADWIKPIDFGDEDDETFNRGYPSYAALESNKAKPQWQQYNPTIGGKQIDPSKFVFLDTMSAPQRQPPPPQMVSSPPEMGAPSQEEFFDIPAATQRPLPSPAKSLALPLRDYLYPLSSQKSKATTRDAPSGGGYGSSARGPRRPGASTRPTRSHPGGYGSTAFDPRARASHPGRRDAPRTRSRPPAEKRYSQWREAGPSPGGYGAPQSENEGVNYLYPLSSQKSKEPKTKKNGPPAPAYGAMGGGYGAPAPFYGEGAPKLQPPTKSSRSLRQPLPLPSPAASARAYPSYAAAAPAAAAPAAATEDIAGAAMTTCKIQKNYGVRTKVPPKEITGVDPSITEICASLSNQIYDASSNDYFKLEASDGTQATILILDTHGHHSPAIPSFAVAAVGSTLIMGWSGTNPDQVMDVIHDAAMAPVVCSDLGTAASGIRCHAMFSACVGSELHVHQEEIIKIINDRNIDQLVFTGHSLGGALASTAHIFVQAQISGYNKSSPWDKVGDLTLRAVTFAAVMSVIEQDKAEDNNTHSKSLLENVGANTVNFVFNMDPVPRGYSHIEYIRAMIESIAPDAVRGATPWWVGPFVRGKAAQAVIGFLIDIVKPLVPIAVEFRHTGKLIYYKCEKTVNPHILKDTGPAGETNNTSDDHLNYYTLSSYGIGKNEVLKTMLKAHSHFPKAFAPYISVKYTHL